ncbi:MAG: hypothetical protein ABIZ72_02620 [Candidatus Limnocylindrales bacterium]
MFSTLLGPLPPAPDAPPDAAPDADRRLEDALALAAVGLEVISDGGPASGRADAADAVVDRWRAVAGVTGAAVKAVLVGPWTDAVTSPRNANELAERLRPTILALAAAGCPLVEIAETDVASIATDPSAAHAFAEAHRRLVDGSEGVHCSLALTGASLDGAGAATFFDLAYASYAFDLIAGPDNWRLIAEAPSDRGIVCGAIGLAADADATREVLVWAAHYAASTRGRGLARVGLANAPSMPGTPSPDRGETLRRLAIVAEASRIAAVESAEEMAGMLDPRAIDPRSAAFGRFAPAGRRRRS